jgi:hypothetical protein
VIGSAIADSGHHHHRYGYRYYDRGNRAEGAAVGGVLGAVVGGAIASGNCY